VTSTRQASFELIRSAFENPETGLIGQSGPLGDRFNYARNVMLNEDESLILWEPIAFATRETWVDDTRLLDRITGIRTPDDARQVASQFGPLMLCEHGVPYIHDKPSSQVGTSLVPGAGSPIKWDGRCLPLSYQDGTTALTHVDTGDRRIKSGLYPPYLQFGTYGESVDAWIRLADRVRGFIEFIYWLRENSAGLNPMSAFDKAMGRPVWESLQEATDVELQQEWNLTRIDLTGYLLANGAWGLARLGGVTMRFDPRSDSIYELDGVTVLGSLGIQLLNLLKAPTTLARCMNCQRIYEPRRKPKKRQDNYCQELKCQRAGAAMRKRRQRRANKA